MGEEKQVETPTTAKFTIGEREVVLRPLKLGKFRKVVDKVSDAMDSFGKQESKSVKGIVGAVLDQAEEIIPMLFDDKVYPFLTKDYIEEHVEVPQAQEIMVRAIEINHLFEMFPALRKFVKGSGEAK